MENNVKKKNKIWYRIFFAILTIAIVAMLFFLFKNIILNIIEYTKADDQEGLKAFMREKGWIGYIAVVLIEALEMVVIFIPAEFIQIPAGLSFPFIISILLCDLGVVVGASIIYFLVHVLKFDNEFIEKKQKKIKNLAQKRKSESTQLIMYFLFVTPIIPFGAICYYASNTKISYRRYILTCSTGVLPSIITSIIMGTSIKYFIAEALPIWLLVLIIVGLGAILFVGMFFLSRKFLFNGKKVRGTPNSLWSPVASFLMSVYVKRHAKAIYIENNVYEKMGSIPGAKIYLANHLSPNDLYHVYRYVDPDHPALVANRYYMRFGIVRWFLKKLGFIPKSLFNADMEAIKKMMYYAKEDTSILMYPEARLSLDGTSNKLTIGTANLVKKLGLPVVLIEISGNYLANSKVRTARRRVPVTIEAKRIITQDELADLDVNSLEDIISTNLAHNEFEYAKQLSIKDNNKAQNLEHVLYLCPKCHQEFKMHSHENTLECECGFKLELDDSFQFNENEYGFANIHDYYEYIKAYELSKIKDSKEEVIFIQDVIVKKVSFENKKLDEYGEGKCILSKKGFAFSGSINGEDLEFSHPFESLQALAFSINEEYECYYNNVLYYFYPKDNKSSCTKVSLLYDCLYENKDVMK